jgi:hypothetical protein
MKDRDKILQRLFSAARQTEAPAAMPFGFDTRVLALAQAGASNGSAVLALFARRAAVMALAVIGLGATGLYVTSMPERNWELTTEYGITETAIQNNLLE